MPTKLDKVLYTAHAHTVGGRDGRSVTDDGLLDVKLTLPKAMGGAGTGTNPEQLFAAGYSACFMGALKHVASLKKVAVPADAAIDASVDIGPIPAGFGIAARLVVSLPGLDRAVAQDLVDTAHQVCPYSNATRGNIEVELTLA
ncbi:organic hydroperoxide resistance protein [Rhodoferax sp. GW822-FHT02A01]|jgi:Ohr subfamily peroxiredoxin|uniref:organic hydroperoxide resistance protein n=1 Tax=Rhodoferax sp. GW822-FHT02A01 TaxID=3141537 RepID=UPI00315D9E93